MSGSHAMRQRLERIEDPAAETRPAPLRPVDGHRRLSSAGGWCASPAIARRAGGGFVTVWQRYAGACEIAYEIAGRLLTAVGEPSGVEFHVESTPSIGQAVPRLAAAVDGGFLVVWESRPSGHERDVLARAFDAEGRPIGPTFLVDPESDEQQGDPDLAATGDGGYVVVWSCGPSDRAGRALRIRRFDAGGRALSGPIEILPAGGRGSWPALARGAGGGFVVAWVGPAEGAAAGTVRARRFDRAGAPVGDELRVDGGRATCGTSAPAIAAGRDGGFAVAWLDYSERGDALRFCAFFADGSRALGETTVARGCSAFAVDGADDGRLSLVWSTLGSAIEMTHFLPDGRPAGADACVVADGAAGGHTPRLALGPRGPLVAWQGFDDADGNAEIRLRAFRTQASPARERKP